MENLVCPYRAMAFGSSNELAGDVYWNLRKAANWRKRISYNTCDVKG
jgi:hypothetical protein